MIGDKNVIFSFGILRTLLEANQSKAVDGYGFVE
jgi:hypothetical protein